MSDELATQQKLLQYMTEAIDLTLKLCDSKDNKIEMDSLNKIAETLTGFHKTRIEPQVVRLNLQSAQNEIKAIDSKVFHSKKIDFKEMQKIMDAITTKNYYMKNLNAIRTGIEVYIKGQPLSESQSVAKKVQDIIDLMINDIETETRELKTQLENVNLFYQNFMVSKAVTIAYASLFVSSIAFLLTILQALHII